MNGQGRDGGVAAPVLPAQPSETVEERLKRLAQWCTEGRAAAAEVELHEWLRDADCPPTAMALFVSLLSHRGDLESAIGVLHGRVRVAAEGDLNVAMLRATVLARADLNEAARRAAAALHHAHGHNENVAAWLRNMEIPGGAELTAVPTAAVEQLAGELVRRPELAATLVAAQRIEPDPVSVAMLRGAVSRIARDADDEHGRVACCTALAELALLANDADDARRWAHRGLKINPYAAPLALVLAQIEDDPAVGPPALNVLETVAAAHPDYADVQAALIRREQRQGMTDSARLRLQRWLERRPDHPAANRLAKELAA